MNELGRELRLALRGLRRTPTFTLTAVAILGVGIGAAVAMSTVFRAVLVERLPVNDPAHVVVLSTYKDPAVEFGLQRRHLDVVHREARTVRDIAGYAHWGVSPFPLLDGDRSVLMGRVVISGRFFDVLGARPLLGRLLRAEDEVLGATPVIVLSYKAWQQQFGGDSRIVGRRLYEPYSQLTYQVVGVAPAGLDYPSGAGFWMTWPGANMLSVIAVARLAPAASPEAARGEVFSIVRRTSPEYHLTGATVTTLPQAMLGDVRPVLVVLTAAVGLLLLIACGNVGNLLLLRAASRARELAIRRAFGATYADVVRQLVLESALLAVAGGVLGLACAKALVRGLLAFAPTQLPRTDVIELAGTPLVAAIGITMFAVLLFGVVPALVAARADVAGTLRLDARSGRDSAARRRMRQLLVAAQTTLALVMLAASLLLAKSLERLESIDLGYEPEHLSLLAASWPSKRYDSTSKLVPLGEELTRRWRAIPGVAAVTPTLIPPLVGPNVFLSRLDIEGQSDAERASNAIVAVEAGGKEYFRTFGISLRRGRAFTDDDNENAPFVAIVSEAVAHRFWPGQDPIGKRIHYWGADTTKWRTVVGVAGETHLRALRDATPTVYIPWRQANFWQFNFAMRTARPLSSLLPAIRRELRAVDPQLALWYVNSMDDLIAAPLARPRTSVLLMSAFGGVALLLASIGLYGLMASFVRERTHEIGIRMALGAAPTRVRCDVLAQALVVVGLGAAAGVVIALGASRLLETVLFDVRPTDPLAIGGACAILLLVSLVAAFVPARWATRVDPASALRAD